MSSIFNVFLPVHNRSKTTSAFLIHLKSLVPTHISLRLWIIDDGCTDDTITSASAIIKPYAVIRLNGKAYWGGSINIMINCIRDDLSIKNSNIVSNELVMLCNDDIRFPCSSFFDYFLRLDCSTVLCCSPFYVDYDPDDPSIPNIALDISLKSYYYYDPDTLSFCKTRNASLANVSPTHAIISRTNAWITSSLLPRSVPHYLSDYWLTHQMHKNGFSLRFPSDFVCFVAQASSRNRYGPKQGPSNGYDPLVSCGLKSILKRKITSAYKLADPLSVGYPPAWHTFHLNYGNTSSSFIDNTAWRASFLLPQLIRVALNLLPRSVRALFLNSELCP
jgi:GT2 family glycosyltransferase